MTTLDIDDPNYGLDWEPRKARNPLACRCGEGG